VNCKTPNGIERDSSGTQINAQAHGLIIPGWALAEMLSHVRSCLPEEACGFLGGLRGTVVQVLPVENELHSASRYRMQPHQQYQAMMKIEADGLGLVGIFHSHPHGPEFPSNSDLNEAAIPGALHLIWAPGNGDWRCRAFLLEDGKVHEVPIRIEDPS